MRITAKCLSLNVALLCAQADPLDHWHWRSPLPTGDGFLQVIAGDSGFVAFPLQADGVAASFISRDGLNWTSSEISANRDPFLPDAAYGKGVFIAADGTHLYSSTDGVNWAERASIPSTTVAPICYAGSVFFASDWRSDGQTSIHSIYSSSDGIQWTHDPIAVFPGDFGYTPKFAFGGGKFLATSGGKLFNSTDGQAWTEQSIDPALHAMDVAFGAGRFIITAQVGELSSNGNNVILTSADGASWTQETQNLYSNPYRVTYTGEYFYVFGPRVFSSVNGLDWQEQTALEELGVCTLAGISYAGGRYVANFYSCGLLTSTNGSDWETLPGAINPGVTFSGIAYGNGKFVAAGNLNGPSAALENLSNLKVLFSSADGSSWKEVSRTPADDADWGFQSGGVVFGGGLFVAFGSSILTSQDGIAWTEQTNWCCIPRMTYGNGLFIGLSDPGVNETNSVLISGDGQQWRALPTPAEFDRIVAGEHVFVAISGEGGGAPVTAWSSENGITWTERFVGNDFDFRSIYFTSGKFYLWGFNVTTAEDGTINSQPALFSSTDGIIWTSTPSSGLPPFRPAIQYAEGLWVAVTPGTWGGAGIQSSLDGLSWTTRISTEQRLYAAAFGNDTFIAVGDSGAILQSDPIESSLRGADLARDGTFSFDLHAESGRTYELQASPDLIEWAPLSPVTAANDITHLSISTPNTIPHMFYRVMAR